jgi:predicted small secreted protein
MPRATLLLAAASTSVTGCDPESVRSAGGQALFYCFAAQ